MKLIYRRGEDRGEGFLFLVSTEDTEAEGFRMFAETEFYDLSSEDENSLEFFVEEFNETSK